MLSGQPDIICLQECHNDQFTDLQAGLGSGWSACRIMSFPGGFYPENAIFFRNGLHAICRTGKVPYVLEMEIPAITLRIS